MRLLRAMIQEWRDAADRPAQRLPTALQFPINDICNSGCQMCHIWKRKRDFELSPVQVREILSNPLFRNVRGIGINGGEPTLRPDLPQIMEAVVQTLPRLEGVSLITNAIRASRVIQAIDDVGRICRAAGKKLDVMVSLDGVGDVHDRVRGTPGNFASAEQVIDHLLATPWVDSRRIGCTMIAENAFDVENVLAFAQRRGIYARFRLGVPHPRLYTGEVREPFALAPGQLFHIAAFLDHLVTSYETDPRRRGFYHSLRNQLVYGRGRVAGCAWKNHGVTLGPRGELAFCAVASPRIGNALNESAEQAFWAGSTALQDIQRTKCADCRHDYDGPENRRTLARRWLGAAVRRLPDAGQRAVFAAVRSARHAGEWARVFSEPTPPRGRRAVARLPRKVLLCGWYGTETLGDRAILAGLVRLWREEAPGVSIELASLEPYVSNETLRLMPELQPITVVSLADAGARAAAGDYGVVALAGGPLMTPVREVIDLARILEAARRAGSVTAVLGCGLGPISAHGPRRLAIARLMRDAEIVILRDHASAKLARRLGRTGITDVAVDPAFFWTALQRSSPKIPGVTVALALRDWPVSEYAGALSAAGAARVKTSFEDELLKCVDALEAAGAGIELICMHTLPVGGDDRWFYARLFAQRPKLLQRLQWRRRSPAEECAVMAGADAVLAMRFHSCVFSLAMNKPFLALDYTRGGKIAGLLGDSGNRDRLIALEDFDGAQAAARLLADISQGRVPLPPAVADGEAVYRGALRSLTARLPATIEPQRAV